MVYSMTGFGTAVSAFEGKQIDVQVKTLNNKSLDISLRMMQPSPKIEILIQKLVKQFVARGRVDITINVTDNTPARGALPDVALINERIASLKHIAGDTLTTAECLRICLNRADSWTSADKWEPGDRYWECVLETVWQAMASLTKSRKTEGQAIEAYMTSAIDSLRECLDKARSRAVARVPEYAAMLAERIESLTGDHNPVPPERIAAEAAIVADKMDVTEEMTRIAAHLSELERLIAGPADPLQCMGKRIDFYLQELNREATTTASKSRDAQLTGITIDMRTVIESAREQAANIQ